MKRIILAGLMLCSYLANAAEGDTIKVRSHDRVHMNWNGNFDRMAHFPTQGKSFNKVLMNFTLGCPDKGCSEWDYTVQVFYRDHTGNMDSTLKTTPNFRVDGSAKDSLRYNSDSTYTYFYNSTTQAIDSSANQPVQLIRFLDAQNPLIPTDTLTVWDASTMRPEYDMNGAIISSEYIAFDNIIYRQDHSYYQVFEVVKNLELARLITPYAGGKTKTWSHTYTFDITDFAFLLEDSVDIRTHYSGYQDGFTVTLDFELIEGTPAMECYKIETLWQGSFPYGNPNNSIENYLKNIRVNPEADFADAKLRVIQTGHGFGGNENCAEFCPKKHFVKVNGSQKFSTLIWKDDCGMNAIYPQPGTWIYDRSNWCPGSAIRPYDYYIGDVLQKGDSNDIDLDMEAFTNNGNNSCSYIVSGMLFYYKKAAYKNDASLEAILAPSNDSRYVRYNPTCGDPLVRVKNNGTDTIHSLVFKYGLMNGDERTWRWTGTIAPHEDAELRLANFDWTNAKMGLFYAKIDKVNEVTDEVAINNMNSSTFDLVPEFPTEFQIWFRTNTKPTENSLYILNADGSEVWSRDNFTQSNNMHADTIKLVDGCYAFEIRDKGKNGIKFWANSDGTGSLNIRAIPGNMLQNIDGDFGTAYRTYFTVGHPLGINKEEVRFMIYPNPAANSVHIEHNGFAGEIEILDINGRVLNTANSDGDSLRTELKTQNLLPGVYFIRLKGNQGTGIQKLVIQR